MRSLITIATLLIASAAADARQSSGPLFRTWRGFATGDGFDVATGYFPYAHALADLDGDGDLDAVFANSDWFSPKISVLIKQADHTYAAPVYYAMPRGSIDIVAADFTADGRADVVAVNYDGSNSSNSLSFFRNRGDGTLAPAVTLTGTPVPGSLVAIDFDADGDLDIAALREDFLNPSTIALKVNDGSGTFSTGPTLAAGTGSMRLASGDVTGDGLADLIVQNYSPTAPALIHLLRNTGGGFAAPEAIVADQSNASGNTCRPAIADADRDGDLDLVLTSAVGLALLRNSGNGTFAPAVQLRLSVSGVKGIAIADLTGNGWPDLAVAGRQLEVLIDNGTGGFRPTSATRVYASGEDPSDIDASDVDGDGDNDLLVTNLDSVQFNVHLNPGDGNFQPVTLYPIPTGTALTLDSGDIDGDGDRDIVTGGGFADAFPQVSIFLNNGDGTLAPAITYDPGRTLEELRLKDLNGDGLADLLWIPWLGTPPYHFYTALADGQGSFGTKRTWPIDTCGSGDIDAFDLDHDGDLDVIVSENRGCPGIPGSGRRFFLARNHGDGTFDLLPPVVLDAPSAAIGAADFNRDGVLDLTSGLEVIFGNGDFTFSAPMNVSVGLDVEVGDFNSDGWPDLAGIFQYENERVTVRLNNGDGTFGTIREYRASHSTYLDGLSGLVVGDADGDGDVDIFGANYGSHDFSYYLNVGDGTFAPQVRYGVSGGFSNGGGPLDSVACDLDGDGSLDLVAVAERAAAPPGVVAVLFGGTSWWNYGSGWPGTNGVPCFTSNSDPELCSSVCLTVCNSLRLATPGVLLLGLSPADLPTSWGGRLLVLPYRVAQLNLPGSGEALCGLIPCDLPLCGLHLYLQVLELDAGASHGVSFTPGLELVLGC